MDAKKLFKFCPKCGGDLKPQIESLECQKCGFHLYINPVPCNGAIIENDNGEILLVKRRFEPGAGLWDLPGGFVRAGEDLEVSVKREVKEEIGVKVEVGRISGVYVDDYVYDGVLNKTFCLIATAKIIGGELKAEDDVADIKYFKKKDSIGEHIAFRGIKKALEDYLKNGSGF